MICISLRSTMDISSRGMQPIDASEKATETPKKEPLGIFRTRYLNVFDGKNREIYWWLMNIYAYTYIYIYIYTWICCMLVYVCMYIYIYKYTHTYIQSIHVFSAFCGFFPSRCLNDGASGAEDEAQSWAQSTTTATAEGRWQRAGWMEFYNRCNGVYKPTYNWIKLDRNHIFFFYFFVLPWITVIFRFQSQPESRSDQISQPHMQANNPKEGAGRDSFLASGTLCLSMSHVVQ